MYQDSMIDMAESPDSANNEQATANRQHQQTSLIVPIHTIIGNGCERIKKELETIQASNNSLLIEHNTLITAKYELEKKYQASDERTRSLFMEMSRQREVANRLESLIMKLIPFLPADKQLEIGNSIYLAKQFTSDDLKQLAEQRISDSSIVVPANIWLDRSPDDRLAEVTSLTNLVLQILLMNATSNNGNSSSAPNVAEVEEHNQQAKAEQSNITCNAWPISNNTKSPPSAPAKRKRTVKRKVTAPAKNSLIQRDRQLEAERKLTQPGMTRYLQNCSQPKPRTYSLSDVKPNFKPEGQENNRIARPATPTSSQKAMKQKTMHEYLSK